MIRFVFLVVALCAVANAQSGYDPIYALQYPWPYQQQQQQPQYMPQYQYNEPPQYQYSQQLEFPYPAAQMQYYYQGQQQNQMYPEFQQELMRAVVKLDGETINGVVNFTQAVGGGPVRVQGYVNGLQTKLNGFHVHEKGDLTGGCLSAGSHFNPHKMNHGGPDDQHRHVGDLGNIVSRNGRAEFNFEDNFLSLTGQNNIIGRAVVVHSGVDDLGKTDHPDSKTTGNAGGRLACGVIGVVNMPNSSSKTITSHVLLLSALLSVIKFFY